MIVPVLNSEGYLIAPRKQGKEWFVCSEKIVLNFTECSILEQIGYGSQVATSFLTIFVLMFCFRLVAKFISESGCMMVVDFPFLMGFFAVLSLIFLLKY